MSLRISVWRGCDLIQPSSLVWDMRAPVWVRSCTGRDGREPFQGVKDLLLFPILGLVDEDGFVRDVDLVFSDFTLGKQHVEDLVPEDDLYPSSQDGTLP